MLVGKATSWPLKLEPSDIDTETAATTVPAAALSGRDTLPGVKVNTRRYRRWRRRAQTDYLNRD